MTISERESLERFERLSKLLATVPGGSLRAQVHNLKLQHGSDPLVRELSEGAIRVMITRGRARQRAQRRPTEQ